MNLAAVGGRKYVNAAKLEKIAVLPKASSGAVKIKLYVEKIKENV